MSDLALRVEGLSKSFRLGHRSSLHRFSKRLETLVSRITGQPLPSTKSEAAVESSHNRDDTFWALKDVTFEVNQGEVIGLVGPNGAGKSTLLKLLSRIMYPTHGRMEIRGRVRSILEVGTGFHHDLTGRENIFLNGAILGMSRSEIQQKFDEIVAFSEVDRFLDTAVKYYSSGMYVRLAFAVAAHLEPDILIVDEVLAVGDSSFQQKCIGKMGESSRQGKTVLIVSHRLPVTITLCHRAVLLEGGQVTAIGSAIDVVRQYMTNVRSASGEVVWNSMDTAPGNESVRLNRISIIQEGIEGPTADIEIAKEIRVQIKYWALIPGKQFYVALSLKDANGTFVLASSNVKTISSTDDPTFGIPQSAGPYEASCTIPGNFLNEGRYVISVIIGEIPGKTIILEDSILTFDVHDTGAMHEEFIGNWAGPVIRPRLPWNTIQQSTHA